MGAQSLFMAFNRMVGRFYVFFGEFVRRKSFLKVKFRTSALALGQKDVKLSEQD